jgi:hypothetical protein
MRGLQTPKQELQLNLLGGWRYVCTTASAYIAPNGTMDLSKGELEWIVQEALEA